MTAIWKFVLEDVNNQNLKMPVGAEILHVAEQHGQACLWARVDLDKPSSDVPIGIYRTGQEFESNGKYIGTVLLVGGLHVIHIYDER